MSIENLLASLGLAPRPARGLEAQIDSLRHDIRRVAQGLSRSTSRASEEWGHDLGEFGREAARQSAYLAGVASHQALRGVNVVRSNPVPTIAVIGTALLLARLLRR